MVPNFEPQYLLFHLWLIIQLQSLSNDGILRLDKNNLKTCDVTLYQSIEPAKGRIEEILVEFLLCNLKYAIPDRGVSEIFICSYRSEDIRRLQ